MLSWIIIIILYPYLLSTVGPLLSFVTVFLSFAPPWISLKRAPLLFAFGGRPEDAEKLGGGGPGGGGGGGGGIVLVCHTNQFNFWCLTSVSIKQCILCIND